MLGIGWDRRPMRFESIKVSVFCDVPRSPVARLAVVFGLAGVADQRHVALLEQRLPTGLRLCRAALGAFSVSSHSGVSMPSTRTRTRCCAGAATSTVSPSTTACTVTASPASSPDDRSRSAAHQLRTTMAGSRKNPAAARWPGRPDPVTQRPVRQGPVEGVDKGSPFPAAGAGKCTR